MSPEADRKLDRRADFAAPADEGCAVEVAGRVGVGQVQGGGDEAMVNRQAGDCQLGRAGGAEEVADLALVGRAGDAVGVGAQGEAEGAAFEWVVAPGGGAVDIDMVDLRG